MPIQALGRKLNRFDDADINNDNNNNWGRGDWWGVGVNVRRVKYRRSRHGLDRDNYKILEKQCKPSLIIHGNVH